MAEDFRARIVAARLGAPTMLVGVRVYTGYGCAASDLGTIQRVEVLPNDPWGARDDSHELFVRTDAATCFTPEDLCLAWPSMHKTHGLTAHGLWQRKRYREAVDTWHILNPAAVGVPRHHPLAHLAQKAWQVLCPDGRIRHALYHDRRDAEEGARWAGEVWCSGLPGWHIDEEDELYDPPPCPGGEHTVRPFMGPRV